MNYFDQISAAAAYIRGQAGGAFAPEFGCILGSGLGELADAVENRSVIPFADIPWFPVSTVSGHAGQLVLGTLEGQRVVMMQGRFHYYEGYSMKQVCLPVYVMQQLGIHSLLVSNAAGGMNRNFRAGDLMALTDHLNMTGDSPLMGANDDRLGLRFPDMSEAYDRTYRQLLVEVASEVLGGSEIRLQTGVYAGITGPSYMTPAELTMLARVGGDAIGMSTVGEVIAARHAGLRVLGVSCITDMAIGEHLEPLTHEQVVATANRTKPLFLALVRAFFRRV